MLTSKVWVMAAYTATVAKESLSLSATMCTQTKGRELQWGEAISRSLNYASDYTQIPKANWLKCSSLIRSN